MKRNQIKFFSKTVAVILVFILFHGNWIFPEGQYPEQQEESLLGLFQWAVGDYQSGKYREVCRNLELLFSYFDEKEGKPGNEALKGKILLLLGAAYEQLGDIEKAKAHYRSAREIMDSQKVKLTIEGIDFGYLKEYQVLIMDQQGPVQVKPGVIEKPRVKHKKRGLSPLAIVSGLLVLGGTAAALLLKKKKPADNSNNGGGTYYFNITWVPIPGGEFLMGDNYDRGDPDERPVHPVYLDTYYISSYEITFHQYDYFCEATGRAKPSDNGWGRKGRPVINVSWGDAKAFCDWLSTFLHLEVQLPSEAQWEKAARGTDQRLYPWGNLPSDCAKANYNCHSQTYNVGNFYTGASPYGIYDMAGNVSEWCLDEYDPSYYSRSLYRNPVNTSTNPQGIVYYTIRGGSWDSSEALTVRATDRGWGAYDWGGNSSSDTKTSTIGFRVVYKVPSK